ncbi:transcriptional repressor [Coemansia sp. RSA 1933]|nr:transcriptional repressor [Coemansia sp. RSA 1933]
MPSYQSPTTDLRRPSNLGLWSSAPPTCTTPLSDAGSSHADACAATAPAPDRQVRSLSVRTALGHSVSILNDDTCSSVRSTFSTMSDSSKGSTGSSIGSYRHLSVPELTPDCSPRQTSRSRMSAFSRHSTKSVSPQLTPTRLPSLSALIEAVGMASYAEKARPGAAAHHALCASDRFCSDRFCSHRNAYSQPQMHNSLHMSVPSPVSIHMPIPMPVPCTQSVIPRTIPAKRKYVCTFAGCGKAFTTSGHLSRHFRIHTGEKNYCCLYPGCTSRFSRQDNMMQHYRTHLSPRSRRGRGGRSSGARAGEAAAPAQAVDQRATMGTAADVHNSAFHPYRRTYPQHEQQQMSPPPIHLQWPFY